MGNVNFLHSYLNEYSTKCVKYFPVSYVLTDRFALKIIE